MFGIPQYFLIFMKRLLFNSYRYTTTTTMTKTMTMTMTTPETKLSLETILAEDLFRGAWIVGCSKPPFYRSFFPYLFFSIPYLSFPIPLPSLRFPSSSCSCPSSRIRLLLPFPTSNPAHPLPILLPGLKSNIEAI